MCCTYIELMNNVDVNINQRWSLIAIFDIMWQINVTKCETTILYGVCTKSNYRCREEWGRVRSSPTPRGCAGFIRRPTGPRRAGPLSGTPSGASHRLWTIHYLPCTCVRFNAVVLRARFDETRSIMTWGSWPRCWRTGKSECLFYLTSPFLRMVLSRTERPWHRTGFSTSGILGRR